MTDIEQAARAEAVRDIEALRDLTTEEAFAEGASWLAEYLLSDDNVEKAARALDPEAWDEDRYWLVLDRRTEYRMQALAAARSALQAVLGKEQP